VRILIDTHVLLWAALGDARLSPAAEAIIGDRSQELLFSPVSAMEIPNLHAVFWRAVANCKPRTVN